MPVWLKVVRFADDTTPIVQRQEGDLLASWWGRSKRSWTSSRQPRGRDSSVQHQWAHPHLLHHLWYAGGHCTILSVSTCFLLAHEHNITEPLLVPDSLLWYSYHITVFLCIYQIHIRQFITLFYCYFYVLFLSFLKPHTCLLSYCTDCYSFYVCNKSLSYIPGSVKLYTVINRLDSVSTIKILALAQAPLLAGCRTAHTLETCCSKAFLLFYWFVSLLRWTFCQTDSNKRFRGAIVVLSVDNVMLGQSRSKPVSEHKPNVHIFIN